MKILLLTQSKIDTTSFYRANGVFGNVCKQLKGEVTIDSMDKKTMRLSWADLMLYDLVFMQRPWDNQYMQLASYIKDLNIPLWIDYDDNLLAVPPDNPTFQTYSNPNIKKNITTLLAMADVVSVSTPALKEAYSHHNKNIVVVPNAFNQDLFKYRNIKKRNNSTLWRGSDSHQLDIMAHTMQMQNSIATFKNWDWHFCGYYPWMAIGQVAGKVYHHGITDVIPYHKNIHSIAPKCMMVPLADHNFNRCKSNIAALEGIFAGAVCLVPDWDEWQIPGVLHYKNAQEFQSHLENIYHGKIKIADNNTLGWEYINDVYALSTVNKKRVEIIKSLV